MTGELQSVRWRGIDQRGGAHAGGGVKTLAEVCAMTRLYFERGWRELAVYAAADDGHPVAEIGPHPDTGKRTWWAESGETAR